METLNTKVNRGKGVLLGRVAGIGYPADLRELFGDRWSTLINRRGIRSLDPLRLGETPFWEIASNQPLIETLDHWLNVQGKSKTAQILELRYGILDGQLKTARAVDQQLNLHTPAEELESLAITTLKNLLMNKHEFRMYGLSHPYSPKNYR